MALESRLFFRCEGVAMMICLPFLRPIYIHHSLRHIIFFCSSSLGRNRIGGAPEGNAINGKSYSSEAGDFAIPLEHILVPNQTRDQLEMIKKNWFRSIPKVAIWLEIIGSTYRYDYMGSYGNKDWLANCWLIGLRGKKSRLHLGLHAWWISTTWTLFTLEHIVRCCGWRRLERK